MKRFVMSSETLSSGAVVLALRGDIETRHGDHLSGVALTSKQHRDTVEVGTGAWDSKGRPSYAKVDRLLDIDPATVRREGAVLGRRRFDTVIDAVGKLHDIARA